MPTEIVPSSSYKEEVLSWINEAVSEGQNFLESQFGYRDIDEAIRYIQGEQRKRITSPDLSNFSINFVGKAVTDISSALTDLKPILAYKTKNNDFKPQADILTNLGTAWWLQNFIDLKIGLSSQLAQAAGCSYLHFVWNKDLHGGLGDLDIIPLDARNVIPIRPTSSLSIQDTAGVLIKSIKTVNEIIHKYPHLRDFVKADRDFAFSNPGSSTSFARLMGAIRSPALDILQKGRAIEQFKIPGKEIYTLYVRDDTIWEGPGIKHMGYGRRKSEKYPFGEPYLWSYDVRPGEKQYPRNRTIIAGKDIILYDGPNIFWTDLFPVIKNHMDLSFIYPHSYLSKGSMKDLIPIQDAVNELINGMIDASKKALRPNVFADARAISQALLNRYDPRKSGQKLRLRPVAGQGIQMEDPPQMPQYVFELLTFLIDKIEFLSGSRDLSDLTRVKQLPAMESLEALLQALSPQTRLRGRLLEFSIRELGELFKFGVLEFYGAKRRVQILGPDGLTLEDFDFDPGTLIPDGRGIVQDAGVKGGERTIRGFEGTSKIRRAVKLGQSVPFYIAPNTLLELSLVTKKAQALMLRRQGDLDWETMMETLEFGNLEQVKKRMNSELDQKIKLIQEASEGRVGRPPTAQKPPNIESKGDARPVLSES